MKTNPVWQQIKPAPYTRLNAAGHYDVIVVGGGITGLTAAYLLKRAGKTVCLLEKDRLGSGDTGHTSAHLTYVTDPFLPRLVKTFGEDSARLVWQGGAAAISTVEAIATEANINCDFRRVPGFLHASLTGTEDESHDLEEQAELAERLGFAARFIKSVPFLKLPGIRFANQGRFQPLAYLDGLARSVQGDGSAVFEHSEADEIKADPISVRSGKTWITGDYLVIATHVPLMGNASMVGAALLQTKLAPYTSYVLGGKVPKGILPAALFWDTSSPYYYLRVDSQADHDYVIFGGCDHKTGQVDDTRQPFDELSATLSRIVPEATIDHRWSGQVVETTDHLPFIGESAERQFIATGYAGNGLTFGTLAAMMATDAVQGRDNPWKELFAVNRKKIRGGTWDFLKENFDYPYYLLTQRFTEPSVKSIDDIKPGEGKLVKINGQQCACSRDKQGHLSAVSAVCTHLGCLVHWNQAEQTWDCPCHGSRFQATGEVLAGPAETPLETIEVPEAVHAD